VLALAIFLVALALRLGTLPIERGFPFLPFYPAMLAAALFLGAGPGLVVVALSAVAGSFFFLPPYDSFVIKLGSLPALFTFVLCGVLTCGLAHFTRGTLLALQAARRKLQRLQETLPVGLVLTDLDGRFLEFNQAFITLTGYSAAELRRLDCWALTPAKYAAEEARQLRILKETGRFGPFEKEYVRKDGTVVPVKIAGSLFESDGRRGIWSIVEDLTERRRVQGGLEELLREQKAILHSRVVGIVRARNRHIVWANEQFAQMLGYSLEEIIGQPTRMFYPSDDAHADFAATAFPIIARGEVFKAELPQRYKSGAVGWFEITSGKLGEADQIATFVDVTERRRIAAELQHARSDLQAILDHMPARITSWNLDWTNCFANRFAEKQFGIAPGSATGRHVRDIIGEDRYQRTRHHIEASFRGTPQTYEQVEELPNGSLRFSHVTAVPRCQDGVVTGTYVLAADVTDLRITQEMLSAKLEELQRTEQALRESENRLRAITDNVPVAIALYDCADRIQFANREFRRLTARSGRAPGDASTAGDSVEVMRHDGSAELRARARQGEVVRFTISARLDDALRELEVTYVPYLDARGAVTGVYEMSYDVTELRESHARIRELAERLASVREDERRAVAVRLHEGLAQELYAAHLSLQELERDGGERTGVGDLARQLTRAIDQSIADVRNITNHLYPTSLVHLPLLRAIEQLASQFSKRAGVRVSVRQMPEFPDLDTETRVLFFRTAQETLANVARHAAATSVSISLEADSERVAMLVVDDGKGIADTDLHKAGSLGLLGIRERFAAAGGGLIVNHSSPSGTCVTVFVPAPTAELPLNGALCDAVTQAAKLVGGRGV
jgi:PAS domain S-box-containing protein